MPEEFVDKRLAAASGLAKGISAWVKQQQAAKIKEDAAGAQLFKTLLPTLFREKGEESRFARGQQFEESKFEYEKTQDVMGWLFKQLGVEQANVKMYADLYNEERRLGLETRKVGVLEQAEERAQAGQLFEQEKKWPKEVALEESKIEASLAQINVDLAKITSAERMAGLDRTLQMELTKMKNDLELTLAGYQNIRAESALKSEESLDVLDGMMRALEKSNERVWYWQAELAKKATGTEGATNARALQETLDSKQTLVDNINFMRKQLGQPPLTELEMGVEKEKRTLRKDVWKILPKEESAAPAVVPTTVTEVLEQYKSIIKWTQGDLDTIKKMSVSDKADFWSKAYRKMKASGVPEDVIAILEKELGIQ